MCSHKFKVIKEEIIEHTGFLGGRSKEKVITIQCELCGDIGFRRARWGE